MQFNESTTSTQRVVRATNKTDPIYMLGLATIILNSVTAFVVLFSIPITLLIVFIAFLLSGGNVVSSNHADTSVIVGTIARFLLLALLLATTIVNFAYYAKKKTGAKAILTCIAGVLTGIATLINASSLSNI